jgi:hypothetical protein
MVTDDVTGVPGTIVVLPPNLLIVAQVPALVVVTVPAADERHVVPPWVSVMRRVPEAAVLAELLMLAVNPARAPVVANARSRVAATPVTITRGAKRRRRGGMTSDIGEPSFLI